MVLDIADLVGEVVVATDASTMGLGAVLMQKDSRGELRPCAFCSEKLTGLPRKGQRNWLVRDIEAVSVVMGLDKYVVVCRRHGSR